MHFENNFLHKIAKKNDMVQAFRRCYVEVISTEIRYNTEDVKNPHLINNVPASEWRVLRNFGKMAY